MRSAPFLPVLASFAALLTACGGAVDNERIAVAAIDDGEFTIGRLPLGEGAGLLRAGTAQGLVSFDADGRIYPALAERWIASEDGLSYIFRIGDAQWNGGGEVTARQVASILEGRLRELRRGGFGEDLALVEEVDAITERVLEIRLTRPRPNLLELLAQPEFGIVRDSTGSGPMRARRGGGEYELLHRSFALEDGSEQLVPPRIALRLRSPSAAFAAYADDAADVIEGGRFQDVPLLSAAGIESAAIRIDPTQGLFGLMVVEETPFLSEADNRAALSMAIDRTALLAPFDQPEWNPASAPFPASMFGETPLPPPGWSTFDIAERRAEAARRVAAWQSEKGSVPPLRIALPQGAGGRILFARIRADFAAIGIGATRVGADQDTDLRLIDLVADYDGPLWYFARLTCPEARLCSDTVSELIADALEAPSLGERSRIFRDAATALQAEESFIPLAMPLRFSVVRPGIAGHAPNPRGWHLLQYLGGGPTS